MRRLQRKPPGRTSDPGSILLWSVSNLDTLLSRHEAEAQAELARGRLADLG
jgi:hypothetical protein